jgi:hypothetical protein
MAAEELPFGLRLHDGPGPLIRKRYRPESSFPL